MVKLFYGRPEEWSKALRLSFIKNPWALLKKPTRADQWIQERLNNPRVAFWVSFPLMASNVALAVAATSLTVAAPFIGMSATSLQLGVKNYLERQAQTPQLSAADEADLNDAVKWVAHDVAYNQSPGLKAIASQGRLRTLQEQYGISDKDMRERFSSELENKLYEQKGLDPEDVAKHNPDRAETISMERDKLVDQAIPAATEVPAAKLSSPAPAAPAAPAPK